MIPTTAVSGAKVPTGSGSAPATLEEEAYDALLAWLVREAKPGEPIFLRELAKRFGMSRTPLRAAAGRLHEQELVAYDARVGFTVAAPSASDVYELFDLRLMCELHAVRRFFARRDRQLPPDIPRLAEEGRELAELIVGDPAKFPAFSAGDAQFHRFIVALAGSQRLLDWYDRLNLRILIFRLGWTVPLTAERFRLAAGEHVHVAQALQGHDETAARRLLEAHIVRVRDQTIERLLRSNAVETTRPRWMDQFEHVLGEER